MKTMNTIITPYMMYRIVSGKSPKGGKIDKITSAICSIYNRVIYYNFFSNIIIRSCCIVFFTQLSIHCSNLNCVYGFLEGLRDHQYMNSLHGNVHSICIVANNSADIIFCCFDIYVIKFRILLTYIGFGPRLRQKIPRALRFSKAGCYMKKKKNKIRSKNL